MVMVEWNAVGSRKYETGVDRGVLYIDDGLPVPWNGLVSVTESPSGGEPQPFYADGIRYINVSGIEEFGGTIEAFTYPDEFSECDGSYEAAPGLYLGQQRRKVFGLSYRTLIGNDVQGQSHGYKLHLVYSALASPSERVNTTINDSPEAATLSWEFSTTPQYAGTGVRPVAHLVLDTTKLAPRMIEHIEYILYGTSNSDGRLLSPVELINIVKTYIPPTGPEPDPDPDPDVPVDPPTDPDPDPEPDPDPPTDPDPDPDPEPEPDPEPTPNSFHDGGTAGRTTTSTIDGGSASSARSSTVDGGGALA